MAPRLLATKSSPPSGGAQKKIGSILMITAREIHGFTAGSYFPEPPPDGGLDLVTNRQGAI